MNRTAATPVSIQRAAAEPEMRPAAPISTATAIVETASTGADGLPRRAGTSDSAMGVSIAAKNPLTRSVSAALLLEHNVPTTIPRIVAAAFAMSDSPSKV
jgi:hypothetical protein